MLIKSSLALTVVAVLAVAQTPPQIPSGAPPSHPRLLFTQLSKGALQAKVLAAGTVSNAAYNALATYSSFQTSGPPSISNQGSTTVTWSLRRMTEVAFRYQMTGNTGYGNNAKNALLAACNYLIPQGATTTYVQHTYPAALALTFDMVYPLLSASEKATVVGHLEQWISAIAGGSSFAPLSYFNAATENKSFSSFAGAALAGMAIWGDSNYPNLLNSVQANLLRLQNGYRDAFSPDGSVDESYGYYNYGEMNSLNAAIASEGCGFGDILSGTNVLKTPRWLTASLMGTQFVWHGDSGSSHKGMRLDTIGYYVINRTQDPVGLWGQLRIEELQPITDWTVSQAYSPWLNKAMHFPEGLAATLPAKLSSFYRDNLNEGSANSNKTTAYFGVGEGGHALLHNSTSPADKMLGVFYMIRDEWMPHAHEDDGHIAIASEGQHQHQDVGYGGYAEAQSTAHNIVLVAGVAGFNGGTTNYYNPPGPDGRFHGSLGSLALTPTFDYVRGNHEHMWMMERADRSVLMIKDPSDPYVVVISNVKKDGSNRTYREQWASASAASGQGTVSSPMTISKGGKYLRTVYLSPASVSISTSGTMSGGGYTSYMNRASASGTEVSFVSVHAATSCSASSPLQSPLSNTTGGSITRSGKVDKLLVSTDGNAIGDASTTSDGRLAWLRFTSGSVAEWIAAEATDLVHGGLVLLASSEAVNVAVRQGEIHVTTSSGSGAGNLSLAVYAPFLVTEVTVDGDPQAFSQSANQVTLGGGAPPTGPSVSLDDRFYHFNEGDAGDLANLSPAVLIANDGTFTSTGGWATASLKGGTSYQPRPISLSMSLNFLPGAYGHEAVIFAGATPGAGDVFELRVGPQGYGMSVDLFQGGSSVLGAQAPLDLSGCHGRFTLTYDPVLGTAEILDPLGQSLAFGNVSLLSSPYFLDVAVTSFARLDDVAIFDSAEDGVTPQGVVFWGFPSGRAGFALHAPLILASQSAALLYGGVAIDPVTTNYWFFASGMVESGAAPYLANPGQPPASIQQIFFESTATALLTTPGQEFGVSVTTWGGLTLTGLYTY